METLIQLKNIGKRYTNQWIFKNIDFCFSGPGAYVIRGHNGSGKSTLLQLILGHLTPSKGEVSYLINNMNISVEEIYGFISFASPYMELYEEFTLEECIAFQEVYKPWAKNLKAKDIVTLIGIEASKKSIKQFSTGMKQRLKLALAILAESPVLLLDEPTSNLDKNVIKWYQQLVQEYANDKLVVICSNDNQEEYYFCTKELNIGDYKVSSHNP